MNEQPQPKTIEAQMSGNLLAIFAAYKKATGESDSLISKKVYGNADFFKDLEAARVSPSLTKLTQMIDWFRANWPEGAEWPPTRAIFMNQNPR